MGLTPLDAEKFEFPSGFRGYDRNAVEQFRAMVVQALEDNIQDVAQLRRRISELEERLADLKGREDLIQTSMLTAQKTGEDVIANAREEAGLIKARAEADCQAMRNEMARIRAEREEFEYAFHGLLSGFLHRLEKRNPEMASEPQPSVQAAPAMPEPARSPEPMDEMLELMNETLPVDDDDDPDELAAPAPMQRPPSWTPEPPSPRITSSRGNLDERDSDHDDFSRILSEAQQHTAPHVPPAAPPVDVSTPVPPARDMDEDLDISDEVELIDQQVEYEEVADWHVPDMPASVNAEPVPEAPAMPDPPPLEEVEGLRPPPPPEDDPWEAPSEPHADNWAMADEAPEEEEASPAPAPDPFADSELLYGSRLQPSRSMADPPPAPAPEPRYDFEISEPADDAVPDVMQAGADSTPKQTPASNLDEIFGGIKPPPASEEDEDPPYRADW
ncbi:MAG: DivIVA domain-containing protein [Planctomycetales bacterium]|nr:DivIVA domain-containing protein [bacterium]UNM08986.1 MAG: DivIVA domain-containing protein [Planctomycetales bacterium]